MKKSIFMTALFAILVQHAHADLSEDYHQSSTTIYEPYVPPPPPPPVPISLFIPKPDEQHLAKILSAIEHTNALRAEKDLPPLRFDENLTAYAQFRATEIEQKFSHERPNGEMYRACMSIGRAVGENIAGGKGEPHEAILQFKNSPKHYTTLMSAEFTKIGMGMVHIPESKHKYYWVQIFGADNTHSPATFTEQTTAMPIQVAQNTP